MSLGAARDFSFRRKADHADKVPALLDQSANGSLAPECCPLKTSVRRAGHALVFDQHTAGEAHTRIRQLARYARSRGDACAILDSHQKLVLLLKLGRQCKLMCIRILDLRLAPPARASETCMRKLLCQSSVSELDECACSIRASCFRPLCRADPAPLAALAAEAAGERAPCQLDVSHGAESARHVDWQKAEYKTQTK